MDGHGQPTTPGAAESERTEISDGRPMVRELADTLMQVIPVGIIVVDEHASVIETNERARNLLGVTIGDDLREKIPDDQRHVVDLMVRSSQQLLVPGTTQDGQVTLVLLESTPTGFGSVIVAGDAAGHGGNAEQFHEALRAAESANRVQRLMLSRVSHELRTPLNAMLGYAQLISRKLESPDRPFADKILTSGRRLLSLVDDLVDLAQLDAGEIELQIGQHAISGIIEEAISDVSSMAAERSISVHAAGPRNADADNVRCDKGRATQMFSSILYSAIAIATSGTDLIVSWERIGEGVEISVTGTGDRLARIDPVHLFDPLMLSSEIDVPVLGLSLARSLAGAMAGTVDASGVGGTGGHFRLHVTLPHTSSVDDDAAGAPVTRRARPVRVTYIDDDALNLALVEEICRNIGGIHFIAATYGIEGLAKIRSERPDLVLLDLQLPDRYGTDVLEELRSDPVTADLHIVVITADATEATRRRAVAAGADAVLVKPFRLAHLESLLEGFEASPPRD